MDLYLVMAELKKGENVAPDLSSYAAMVAKWRGSGNPPTLQECETKWAELKPKYDAVVADQKKRADFVKAGLNSQDMLEALWDSIANSDNTKLDKLKLLEAGIPK